MIDPAVGCLGAAAGALFTYAFGLADPAVMLALVAGVAALALAYALARMYLHDQHHNHVPRGYSDAKFVPEPVASHRAAPNRDGFSRKKIPQARRSSSQDFAARRNAARSVAHCFALA